MTDVTGLVVGLGAPDRGDDAIGGVIAHVIDEWHSSAVRVVTREDPTALVQLWDGFETVVVVDAVMSGAEPGTVVVRDVGAQGEQLPTAAWAASGRGGSHAFGLAGAVELARALGTLPPHVAVVGVEAGTFALGPMSDAVVASIPRAAAAVFAELARMERRALTCA